MANINNNKSITYLILVLLSFLLPLAIRGYYFRHVLITLLVAIVFTSGFRLVLIAGRLHFGVVAFQAMGAYTSALVVVKLGLSPWLGMLSGAVLAAAVAWSLGYVVLRVGGIYFGLLTLMFNIVINQFLVWAEPLTGGADGVLNIPPPCIGDLSFGTHKVLHYYLALVIMFAAVLTMNRMEKSRIGMAFRAVGQNPLLAQHLGINVTRYRVLVFAATSFFIGLAGAFMVHYLAYVSPDDFKIMTSFYIVSYAVVGGMGSPVGAMIGPCVFITLSEAFNIIREAQPLLYGTVLLMVLLLLPQGMVDLPRVALLLSRKPKGGRMQQNI
jgi:branched-chain amino acid transport system permease protein